MKYHTILKCVATCLLLAALPALAAAQEPIDIGTANYDAFDFDYETYLVPNETGENSVLNILTRISYNRLQFLKEGDGFKAQYELTVELRDEDNELKHGKSIIEVVKADFYDDTENYRMAHISAIPLPVIPGYYTLNVYVEDVETRKRIMRKQEIEIPEHKENEFRVSSIIFIQNFARQGEQLLPLNPIIINTMENTGQTYYAYFNIIPSSDDEKFSIEAELQSVRRSNKFSLKLDKMEKLSDSDKIPVVYELNSDDYPTGMYELKVTVKSGRDKKEVKKEFALAWGDVPVTEKDLKIALQQMEYAFDEVKKADIDDLSYEDKIKLFRTTWAKRDPSPESDINELQQEYFRRVQFTDKYFRAVNKDGWKTDRGMIYILFGPPNDVIRYNFELDTKPIQYWTYYDYNVIFQFYDRNGFGDFELTTPYNFDPMTRPIK
ncbi:GWxTD domain-containing protein [candidate division KSB1 bacterium]